MGIATDVHKNLNLISGSNVSFINDKIEAGSDR